MNPKIELKIGEFSKLNQVTVKTLRYYEEIGLLIPDGIDDNTGYRYYEVSQMQRMSQIINLKNWGFSLNEIQMMFDKGYYEPTEEMMEEKLKSCRAEIQALKKREASLKHGYKQLKNLKIYKNMENVFVKSLPALTVASYRKVIKNYEELNYLCYAVIGPEMKRCGCTCNNLSYCYTVEHDKEHKEFDIDVEYCEAVDQPFVESDCLKCRQVPEVKTAVCINHKGSYNNFHQSMMQLMNYIEQNNYKIIDYPRFSYIDGVWNKEKEEDYLTEIQVPVE